MSRLVTLEHFQFPKSAAILDLKKRWTTCLWQLFNSSASLFKATLTAPCHAQTRQDLPSLLSPTLAHSHINPVSIVFQCNYRGRYITMLARPVSENQHTGEQLGKYISRTNFIGFLSSSYQRQAPHI